MTDLPDPTTDPVEEETFGFFARLVQNDRIANLIERTGDQIMARLDAITTAQGNISTQLTQLSGQIADLQAGTVTQEEIDAVAAQAQSIADAVDAAIEPDAGETPPDDGTGTP